MVNIACVVVEHASRQSCELHGNPNPNPYVYTEPLHVSTWTSVTSKNRQIIARFSDEATTKSRWRGGFGQYATVKISTA